tara:strand:+ start:6514 stop:6732 length:219 start_codon:yes stop_codon:yes gene_type:complete
MTVFAEQEWMNARKAMVMEFAPPIDIIVETFDYGNKLGVGVINGDVRCAVRINSMDQMPDAIDTLKSWMAEA